MNRFERNRQTVRPPSTGDIEKTAALDGIELAESEAEDLSGIITALVMAAGEADRFDTPTLSTFPTSRDAGRRPSADEDPLNAFIRMCEVAGAEDGPLAGWRLGVKDNIAVAGVPMTNGSALTPFTPTLDSVVAERILKAGGSIVGTLNMDDHGGGATGVMSAFGPARNPLDPSRTAGGSSGGAGSAVASGAVDAALGVDQGGSGRIPAACCGVATIKATHGLIPTFGVTPIDHSIDYVTPLARSVREVAILLEVIAGDDWRDPQGIHIPIEIPEYRRAEEDGVSGLRVGVIEESITGVECEPVVVETIDEAVGALEQAGAHVERISAPMWSDASAIFGPYVAHLVGNMVRTEGGSHGHMGYIDADRMHAFATGRRAQSRELNPYVKCWTIASRYLMERYMNVPFGRLHNARLESRLGISELLDAWDLLITPTIPFVAPKLPAIPTPLPDLLADSKASVAFNTSPLNMSGHPAAAVPGLYDADGLPASVQIVASHFDEYTALRAAFVLEDYFSGRRPQ